MDEACSLDKQSKQALSGFDNVWSGFIAVEIGSSRPHSHQAALTEQQKNRLRGSAGPAVLQALGLVAGRNAGFHAVVRGDCVLAADPMRRASQSDHPAHAALQAKSGSGMALAFCPTIFVIGAQSSLHCGFTWCKAVFQGQKYQGYLQSRHLLKV